MAHLMRCSLSKGEAPVKVLAVLIIATGLLAGCAAPRRTVHMMRRRGLRKFCPRCNRLIPPGMAPRANSVCMPDDWSVCGGIVETTAQKLWRILWGTELTPRWVWFLFGFGLAALLLAGCASFAPSPEQVHWQTLADQATTAFRGRPVRIFLIGGRTTGQYFVTGGGMIELGTGNSPRAMEWLLAHELSHHLLGHANHALEQDMAANRTAVHVLELWGHSEAEAVRIVEGQLLAIQKRGSTVTSQGHNWCAEYADIVRRYPDVPSPDNAVCRGKA